MADLNPTCQGPTKLLTTNDQDLLAEKAVLTLVLDLHPLALTQEELDRELSPRAAALAGDDWVTRAIRDLIGSGLLRRSGDSLLPTRAGFKFDELAEL